MGYAANVLSPRRTGHGVVVLRPGSGLHRAFEIDDRARKPEEHRKHWLGNMRADVNGTRAVLETDVQILIREYIDETLCDCTSYVRFYDLFERRDGIWRIFEWNTIYDKDRIDPVVPSWDASGLYAQAELQGAAERFCLHEAQTGEKRPHRARHDRDPRQRRRKDAAPRGARWLAGAAV